MFLITTRTDYSIYGPCLDHYGYRVLRYRHLDMLYYERALVPRGINSVGFSINLTWLRREVTVWYIDNDLLVRGKYFVHMNGSDFDEFTPDRPRPFVHWKDLSPTMLKLIKYEHEITDWNLYVASFMETWRTLHELLNGRSLRRPL